MGTIRYRRKDRGMHTDCDENERQEETASIEAHSEEEEGGKTSGVGVPKMDRFYT